MRRLSKAIHRFDAPVHRKVYRLTFPRKDRHPSATSPIVETTAQSLSSQRTIPSASFSRIAFDNASSAARASAATTLAAVWPPWGCAVTTCGTATSAHAITGSAPRPRRDAEFPRLSYIVVCALSRQHRIPTGTKSRNNHEMSVMVIAPRDSSLPVFSVVSA
jgi:hypothetical protein